MIEPAGEFRGGAYLSPLPSESLHKDKGDHCREQNQNGWKQEKPVDHTIQKGKAERTQRHYRAEENLPAQQDNEKYQNNKNFQNI